MLKKRINLSGQEKWKLLTPFFLVISAVVTFSGCSSPSSPKASACACEKDKPAVTIKIDSQDSIIKAAKISGRGVISGALQGEGKDVIKGLLKVGTNAAGERRLLTTAPIPLSGATILIFDAQRATTAAETTLTTDKNGNYTAVLKNGKYYGFAVHLDLQTFRLITASIPFINCKKDSLSKIDTSIAIEDVTNPSVTGVYDATSPDADGLFLVGSISSTNAKISIMFSEPIQRESIRGLIVGKVDPNNVNGSLILKDTLLASSVLPSWSGDSKQLTLSLGQLESDSRYGVLIPTSLKDLAKNPLEKEYKAIFTAVAQTKVSELAFTVAATFPATSENLKPTQNPQISFTRPPQVFSAINSMELSPKVEGYWEVTGPKLTFIHKQPFTVGTTYTISAPDTLIDLNGKKLDKAFSYSFTVKDYEGAAKDKKGRDLVVALLMEDFFNAYLQGDIGRMAGFLDPAFRLESGSEFLSSQQFLDRIRKESSQKSQLNSGFLGPVYRIDAAACSTKVAIRKVASVDQKDTLWVQDNIAAGILPKVYRKAETIATGITWSKTENRLSLDGKDFIFDLPPTNAKDYSHDDRYVGEQLKLNSSVVLEAVKDISKDEFSIDGGIAVTDQDAKVAVKLTTITTHGRFNWDLALACAEPLKVDTSYRIIKFLMNYTGTKWTINHGVDGGLVEKQKFKQSVVATDFKVKEIKPINLLGPTNGIDGAGGTADIVTFRFRGLDFDTVGGYLVGLAEDPKFIGGRGAYGGLYFLKNQGKGLEQTFKLGAKGQVISGATSILRDVQALGLPGWEKTNFKYPITDLYNADSGIAGVYSWKVIAIVDTSAAQFLSNGFSANRFYGESDFGATKGAFAVRGYPRATDFSKLDNQIASVKAPSASVESFVDKDLDGFPDFMELNYKTDANDKASFPNFMVDTDRDAIADFLELLIDPAGVEREASDADKKIFFTALAAKGVKWIDGDGDGFPDDIEKLLGYNPAEASSHPATHARVSAPAGLFSGLLKLGDKAYPVKFKVRQQVDSLFVTYSAYLKDTLTDTVSGELNEAMGEFLFPIRLPDNGLDSGKSLLLRGSYDKTRGLLIGSINRISSIAKNSTHFSGGPFVGQYAASGRGEDVAIYLDLNKPTGTGATTIPNPSVSAAAAAIQATSQSTAPIPAAILGYRKAPSGLGNAKVTLKQNGPKFFSLTLVDEYADTSVVLDSTHVYSQGDGTFDIDARFIRTNPAKQYTRRVELTARLGRGKDAATDIWVIDGSITESVDSCRRFDVSISSVCIDKLYRDVPGQFSFKVAATDGSVKSLTNGMIGDFNGWFQQDKFGTGLADGASQTTGSTTTAAGNTTVTTPVPPESFSKILTGSAATFRNFITKAGIAEGEAMYVSMRGRVMRTTNDSVQIRDGAFPYCGNVQISVTPIPLLDGATTAEKASFTYDSTLATSTKYAVLAIEDEAVPGTPAELSKARDALGFVRNNVFLVESRYLDPATFLGGKCLDGSSLPPQFPLDAGLPSLPSGSAYFRGDLTPLQNALKTSANKIAIVDVNSTFLKTVEINPATLRIDTETKAAATANMDDPSLGYVLLGMEAKVGTPKLLNGMPMGLVK